MVDAKKDSIDLLRGSVEDVITIIDRLAPLCESFDELRGMLELCLTNDAQARLIEKMLVGTKK